MAALKKYSVGNEIPLNPYMSAHELRIRWCCSRSSVDRIARRANIGRVLLGSGRNGMVRYVMADVVKYELSRMIKPP